MSGRRHTPYYDREAGVHTVKVPLWPYLVTPLASCGAWAATAAGHAYWTDRAALAGAASALTLAGAGLTWLAWRATAARGQVRRTVATVAAAGAGMWTVGATIAAPWSHPWLDAWLIGAPAASIAMAILRLAAKRSAEDEQGGGLGDLLDNVKSLKGARIRAPKVDEVKASAAVELEPGVTAGDLQADAGALESVLDVRPGAVRVVPSDTSARRGRVEIVPHDQLTGDLRWPGPASPGASIAAPIPLGVMEDGSRLEIWLPGDAAAGRNASHWTVVGMSGSGKTEVILTLAAEVLTRRDTELWIADPRKGAQLPEWVRRHAARVATTATDTDDMLGDLRADVATRAAWLGERGHKQWTPRAGRDGLPYRVVIVDEAAEVVAGNPLVVDLSEVCRSAGISLVLGLQRASYDRIPTSARANIPGAICLGVKDETDAGMALSPETLDAGARPWTWKASKPGYLYAEVPGTAPERWIMPGRSYWTPPADEDRRGALVATARRELGNLPAEVLPAEIDKGDPPVPAARQRPDLPDDVDPVAGDPPDDCDPATSLAIPERPRWMLGDPPVKAAPSEAMDALRTWIYTQDDAGATMIRPSDLGDLIHETGLSGSWFRSRLDGLCEGPDAMLRKTDRGVWRIRIPEPV